MFNRLVVGIMDGDGKLGPFQPYDEFQNGPKNLEIISYLNGQKLFDILYDELGYIRYEDNKFALKYIFQNNLHNSAMTLLGKVAEAVIVRRSNSNIEINKKWLSLARKKNAKTKTAEKFHAIGTGLLSTQQSYPTKYNPTNPQRDIIWINNDGQTALTKGSSATAGLEAGLQVKVSKNGYAYFFNALFNVRYEIPVVYFDISNDFDYVAQELYRSKLFSENKIIFGEDLIKASAVDFEADQEVRLYVELIEALVAGRITPDYLINIAEHQPTPALQNAILSTSLSQINLTNIIQR